MIFQRNLRKQALHQGSNCTKTISLKSRFCHYYNNFEAASSSTVVARDSRVGLFLELDGAVVDVQMDVHRVAFNRAFCSLGLDCTEWTPVVYNDLLASGDGTGEGLVIRYYSNIGWPLSVTSNERGLFASKVHGLKQQEVQKMIKTGAITLRPGIKEVLKEALDDGAALALLAGVTSGELGRDLLGPALSALGPEIADRVTTFSLGGSSGLEGEGADSEGVGGKSVFEALASATAQERARQAQDFVSQLAASSNKAVKLTVDPNLLTQGGRGGLQVELLSAIAATLGISLARCLLVASTNSTLEVGYAAGMIPIALPRRLGFQGSFPVARAKFEGWGVGNAAWRRLKSLVG